MAMLVEKDEQPSSSADAQGSDHSDMIQEDPLQKVVNAVDNARQLSRGPLNVKREKWQQWVA